MALQDEKGLCVPAEDAATGDAAASDGAAGDAAVRQLELSVVMPCLNEERTVGVCVEKAVRTMAALEVNGEVIVVNNGSNRWERQPARRQGIVAVLRRARAGDGRLFVVLAAAVGLPVLAIWLSTSQVASPARRIFAGTLATLGIEVIFASFLVGILDFPRESS